MSITHEEWSGLSKFPAGTQSHKTITNFLATADFKYLEQDALNLRIRLQPDLPCTTTCKIDQTKFASGRQNIVMDVAFSDDVHWIARVPYHNAANSEPELDSDMVILLSEIATMKLVREHTSIPVPQIYASVVSAHQPFGFPYILMERLSGQTLSDPLTEAIPQQYIAKVAKQLANVLFELYNLRFDQIGRIWNGEHGNEPITSRPMEWHPLRGPLKTSYEYFYGLVHSQNLEAVQVHADGNEKDWLTACWMYKMALSLAIVDEWARGPFSLCHLDLHYGNLMFDDEYNLTGVIDWTSAHAAPVEMLVVNPEFGWYRSASEEIQQNMTEFRNHIIYFLKLLEADKDCEGQSGKGSAESDTADCRTTSEQITGDLSTEVDSAGCEQIEPRTTLSSFLSSANAEMTWKVMTGKSPLRIIGGKILAKHVYEGKISWEQLKDIFGSLPLV